MNPLPPSVGSADHADGEEEEPVDDGDDSEDDLEPVDEFISYIENLFFNQKLTAQNVCVIMWLVEKMGHPEVKPYALKPTAQTGHFHRKLDKALGLRKQDLELYPVNVPLKDIRTGYRTASDVLSQPAHEALSLELEENIRVLDTWTQNITDAQEWIQAYERHDEVKKATMEERKRLLPITIYMDGAEYNKKDGLIVFTVRFSFSRKRHLCWAVRKTNLCDCGCGGWCSLYGFFNFVKWSLEAVQEGRWPSRRHDGGELDAARAAKAGTLMKFRGVVVDICGDWREFSSSWGFPPWNGYFPCFCCDTDRETMVNPEAVVRMRKNDEYEGICQASEIIVVVTSQALQMKIRFLLISDSKLKGRVLAADIPTSIPKLLRGDRIEPTAERPDTHAIDVIEEPWKPFVLKFWRAPDKKKIVVNHRNPVLTIQLGIGYWTFSLDVLHCLHLGVFQAWITRVLRLLFDLDAFETRQTRIDDHLRCCGLELMARLKSWYPKYEKSLPEAARRGVTRINVITGKMLGKKEKKIIKFKAAETRHFLPFALDLARQFEEQLAEVCDAASLIHAGECLQDWMAICNAHGRKLPPGVSTELTRLMYQHNICAHAAGVKMLPKHHQAHFFLF